MLSPVRRTRLVLVALALLVSALLAGCGGGGGGSGASSSGGGTPDSSDFVPAGAPAYVYVNSDTGGDQWSTLDSLSKKFPNRQQLLTQIKTAMQQEGVDWETDVKPALGPEIGVGVLAIAGGGSAVGLMQPKDDAKFQALVKKLDSSDPTGGPTVTRKIDGWTALSDKASSIDAAAKAHDGASLADDSTFQSAMSELPDDALAKFYVDGQALKNALQNSAGGSSFSTFSGTPRFIAGALEAKDDGIAFSAVAKGGQQPETASYKPTLLDQIPSGALACVSFDNLGKSIDQLASNPVVQRYVGTIEQSFGVTLEQVADLFRGEGALYVRQGTPLPEITLALTTTDEQGVLATLDKLAERAATGLNGRVERTTIDGVAARRIALQQFALYYGAFDGKLVITDSPTGISGLKDGGDKLSDDPVFKDAKSAAGMPDETKGFIYVNVKDTVPLVENLAALAGGGGVPPDVSANLEHVRSFLAYASGSGDENRVDAFLQIR
jgi:hypothetical protein